MTRDATECGTANLRSSPLKAEDAIPPIASRALPRAPYVSIRWSLSSGGLSRRATILFGRSYPRKAPFRANAEGRSGASIA